MKYKIIVLISVFIILVSLVYINFGQLIGGGVVCDPGENYEDCIKNSPTYAIDGFTYGEFLPYQHYLLLIIPAVLGIVIWKMYKRLRK